MKYAQCVHMQGPLSSADLNVSAAFLVLNTKSSSVLAALFNSLLLLVLVRPVLVVLVLVPLLLVLLLRTLSGVDLHSWSSSCNSWCGLQSRQRSPIT